ALPEDELAKAQNNGRLHRNFMGYTIQSAPDMIGFGMSSIGYINDTFIQNSSQLETYEELMKNKGFAVYRGLELSQDDLIRQYVISNLMCNFKVSFDDLHEKYDVKYKDYFADDDPHLAPFIEDGFLLRTNEGIQVTQLGRTFVRNIAMTYDAYLKDPQQKTTFSRTI
ncbi:MAG: oxygen-independent coproporphyrinogen III oxidase, partial [bacterium]